jgi:hypothetical protein
MLGALVDCWSKSLRQNHLDNLRRLLREEKKLLFNSNAKCHLFATLLSWVWHQYNVHHHLVTSK